MNLSAKGDTPEGAKQILSVLDRNEIPYQVREFEAPAHHASEAADLLGCPLGAVVKSLLFQKVSSGDFLLVLVSGENRVDIDTLSELVGESVHPASPDDVEKRTGYAVGAVPPFRMKGSFPVIIDESLMAYERVWGSAGAINILLGIHPEDLQNLSQGQIKSIKQDLQI